MAARPPTKTNSPHTESSTQSESFYTVTETGEAPSPTQSNTPYYSPSESAYTASNTPSESVSPSALEGYSLFEDVLPEIKLSGIFLFGARNHYQSNIDRCVTLFTHRLACQIFFKFESLRTQEGFDFVSLKNSDDSFLMPPISGRTLPDPVTYTSSENTLTVCMKTNDAIVELQGFRAFVRAVCPVHVTFDPSVGTTIDTRNFLEIPINIEIPAGVLSTASGNPVEMTIAPISVPRLVEPELPLIYRGSFAIFFEILTSEPVIFAPGLSISFWVDLVDVHAPSDPDPTLLIYNNLWMPSGETCSLPRPSTFIGTVLTAFTCHFTPFVITGLNANSLTETVSESRTFGDPHFIGLFGQRFLFEGQAGKTYSIISTPQFQLNGFLILNEAPEIDGIPAQTVFAEFGILVGNDVIFISKKARLRLNDKKAPDFAVLSDGVSTLSRDIKKDGSGIVLITPEFMIRMVPRDYELDLQEIRMIRVGGEDLHGIVGQTWKTSNWPAIAWEKEIVDQELLFSGLLEGESQDYQVPGLFSSEFKFSRFDRQTFPVVHPVPNFSISMEENKS